MSCLATKEVEICNCSEPRFPINSSGCFSSEQSKLTLHYGKPGHLLSLGSIHLADVRNMTSL